MTDDDDDPGVAPTPPTEALKTLRGICISLAQHRAAVMNINLDQMLPAGNDEEIEERLRQIHTLLLAASRFTEDLCRDLAP